MIDSEILNHLNVVVSECFPEAKFKLTRDTTAIDVAGWDSLSHTVLMMRIEKAFGIRFNDDDMFDLADVGQLCDRINALLL